MSPGRHGEQGATLVLVLAFVTVLGLLGTVLLDQSTAGLGRSSVARDYQEKVYAADAGVDAAIQQLRNDDTLCPGTGLTPPVPELPSPLPAQTINGKTVGTTCSAVSGSSLGARGFAVVTTDGSVDSFETQSGGGGVKKIGGNVFSTRLSNSIDIAVEKGSVLEHASASSCAVPAGPRPGNLFFQPSVSGSTVINAPGPTSVAPWAYRCTTTAWTTYDPGKTLGTSRPRLHPLPTADTVLPDGCRVFRPGEYPAGITFGTNNFLASGIYYFPSGLVTITNQFVIGGEPATGETPVNTGAGCATATNASAPASQSLPVPNGDDPSGTGVTIVLGSSARILVDNPDGKLELYTRTGAPTEAGTAGVSIITVPSPAPAGGWLANTSLVTQPVVQVGTGNTPGLAVHGMIYIPGRMIDMNATNTSVAQLTGGVVAGRILYKASASAGAAGISIGSGSGRRQVEVIATASEPGARNIVTRAVVDIENDAGRSITINSWYTEAD